METVKISAKDVKAIINATFPDYKKREVIIAPANAVTFYDLNWSGGSRSEYRACTIDGKPLNNKVNMNAPAPWVNQFEGMKVEVPQGVVIVKGGTFCGKASMLRIHVNPADMPKYITEK